MRKALLVILIIGIITGYFSCSSPNEISADIDFVYWVIENIDRNFWLNPEEASVFLSFTLSYKGNLGFAGDIEKLRVESFDTAWEIPANYLELDPGNQTIELPSLTSKKRDSNMNSIAIGNYKFTLTLTNGNKSEYTFLVPAPGSTSTNGYSFVYSEDYIGSTSGGITALGRADITSSNIDYTNNTIEFSFDCDSITSNGWIFFYNNVNKYIGKTPQFKNSNNSINNFINNGVNIYSSNNSITLTNSEITFESGYSFDNITKYVFGLTDGKQYSPTVTYDCVSLTGITAF
ncbi:MAG: hypothetical protein JXR70_01680 [Spirochaetales bacterium]|nr:hypothetical protein [Spirochaetales bacterium]